MCPNVKTWNASVAAIAQAWADTCSSSHDPNLHKNGNNFGQNIYESWSSRITTQDKCNYTAGVQSWYDEVQYYNYATNTCQPGKVCGHYTQVG